MIRIRSLLKRPIAALAATLLLATQGFAQSSPAGLITPEDLTADIFFLASDDMAGRNIGTVEDHIATDYIAAEFLRLGLKPVGDQNTFFQNFEVNAGDVDKTNTTLVARINGTEHTYSIDKDFRWNRQSLRPDRACGPILFAGYGISAPEFAYDDLTGADLKGKIVMVFLREPQANDPNSKFMGTLDSYHSFYWDKIETLRKRGAAGVLLVQDRIPRDIKPIPASATRSAGGPAYALAGPMWDLPVFTINREVADQLLAAAGKTADSLQAGIDQTLKSATFEIPQSSVCMTKAYTNLKTLHARNVVAMLEGTDPKLKAETILLSAHHDHMGVINGHIFHGADDNASGVAGILGVARAMVKGGVKPKRTILFIAYDGEERIFLGSYFYVTHPIAPLAKTMATINLDMIGRDEEDPNWPLPADHNANMVNVLGTRYNPGLRRVIDSQNKDSLNLSYKMDTVDPDSLWSRSDHFWFATLHIPQVEFQTGLHHDYHTENDTWDRINYPKLTRITRLVFLSVNALADTSQKIEFTPQGKQQ
jgi:hypothetical protein